MSIAEKLTTIAENQAKVCNAGFAAGYDAGFRAGEDEGFSDGYDDGYAEGYGKGYGTGRAVGILDGKQAAYDAFWDAYQQNGTRTIYEGGFAGNGWTEETFKPKYLQMQPSSAWNMFYCNQVKDGYEYIKRIDFSKCTTLANTFAQCHFEHIGTIDCRASASVPNIFSHARDLKTIDKIIVKASHTYSAQLVENVKTLEDVTFEGDIGNDIVFAGTYSGKKWGERLTKASIESIINHLYDGVSGKTVTLSQTAVNNAFEGGSTGAEWQALIATKTKWNISLV